MRLAIIPARGSSKRLPRKNIVDFMGKPMLAWSIECAMETGLFDRIIVSTEDDEIGAIAEQYGAIWDHRPDELARDTDTVASVCSHLLQTELMKGYSYKTMACLYATAPLRNREDIENAVNLIELENADYAMAVTDYFYNPLEALIVKENNARLMWQDLASLSRHEQPNLKVDAGSTYAVSVPAFLSNNDFYGPNLKVFEVPANRAIDINDSADLDRALWHASKEMISSES